MALEIHTSHSENIMGVSHATTKDGRDPRRKVLVYVVFGKPASMNREGQMGKFCPEATAVVRVLLSRNWKVIQVGALFRMPDQFWKLAYVCNTEKYDMRKFGQRWIWRYKLFYAWAEGAPMSPDLNLMCLWTRMNFDWLMYDKIHKPQLRRHGLRI